LRAGNIETRPSLAGCYHRSPLPQKTGALRAALPNIAPLSRLTDYLCGTRATGLWRKTRHNVEKTYFLDLRGFSEQGTSRHDHLWPVATIEVPPQKTGALRAAPPNIAPLSRLTDYLRGTRAAGLWRKTRHNVEKTYQLDLRGF